MGMPNTGSGRRESYQPHPHAAHDQHLHARRRRHARRTLSSSVKRGLYAVNFGGGQVDITNGKFVFSASEAYLIEDGKVTRAGEGRDADRQRARSAEICVHGRQRSGAR